MAGVFSQPIAESHSDTDPLSSFQSNPDGNVVERIRIRYQIEWQLWAALVKQFQDPAYHMAYLCQAISASQLDIASERYREHRSVMALLLDSRWEAQVADLMLARIENITNARMPAASSGLRFALPAWVMLAPFNGKLMKIAWLAIGFFAAMKLLRFNAGFF